MGGWAARDSPGTGVGEMVTDWGGIRDQLVEGLYHAVGLLISFSSHCILSTARGGGSRGRRAGIHQSFTFFTLPSLGLRRLEGKGKGFWI
jgi:hypothetical protein